MKLPLPEFLRKRWQSSLISSSARSCKGASISQTASSSGSSGIFFSPSTSSSSTSESSSNEGNWINELFQAQKTSSLKETSVRDHPSNSAGKFDGQSLAKLPAFSRRQELEEAFLRFDANHDGKISALELGSVLRSFGDDPSEEELLCMVKEADRDDDGFIDLEEFILLNEAAESTAEVDDLREAFSIFDGDADGKISVKELHCVLSRLGESCTMEECSRMIRCVDMDGDGYVDFEEFCSMMGSQ